MDDLKIQSFAKVVVKYYYILPTAGVLNGFVFQHTAFLSGDKVS